MLSVQKRKGGEPKLKTLLVQNQVEVAHGGARSGRGGSSARGYGGGFGGGITRRSDYRVLVTGLPKTASWQDLKDHMRKAGDVTFAQARLLCLACRVANLVLSHTAGSDYLVQAHSCSHRHVAECEVLLTTRVKGLDF